MITHMDPAEKIKSVNIFIGECFATDKPSVVKTVLGSCVSVCLYDPVARVGGMNHILLPGKAEMDRFDDKARYGINAMELLINRLMKLKAQRKRFVAKVFGGAQILHSYGENNTPGLKNIEFTLNFLKIEKIPVINYDLGGECSRKIFFYTHTGEVLLKRIEGVSLKELSEREKDYRATVNREMQKPGKVEFFD